MLRRVRAWLEAQFGLGSKTPTKLPSQVNDNQYLAASANAAVLDRQTGAYDKYLFEDKEIPEMPFESAVDSHLELMSHRLSQRFKRHISKANLSRIRAQAQMDKQKLGETHAESSRELIREQLAHQIKILNGEASGKYGLTWIGEEPNLISPISASLKLASRYLVFILIGIVDIYIIWRSFQNLGIAAVEAGFLTAPAVAAQLVFPHLAGQRLALMVRGMAKRISVWVELVVLLGVWGTFVYVIAAVRVQFVMQLIRDSGNVAGQNEQQILLFLNLVLLTALGGWLIFLSVRENPHEVSVLRAKIKLYGLDKKVLRANRRFARALERHESASESARALVEELNEAVDSSRVELAEAAKAIYRRALINEMADPEFTRSYYPESDERK